MTQFFVAALTFFSLFSATFASQMPFEHRFTISTPESLDQCTPVIFAWTPTVPPYYLAMTTDPAVLPNFDTQDVGIVPHASWAAWLVDVPERTNVTVFIRDSTGEIAETEPRIVGPGPSYCL